MMKERFVSVAELCEILGISVTRFYKLTHAGSFPEPLRNPANNRPYFNSAMITECQEIVRSRVGKNGLPVTFNRKPGHSKPKATRAVSKHEDLITALASLGVQATTVQVDAALKTLPEGLADGELIKALFLALKKAG
jgi:hypothetical protein